jgi:hypothetical protein
MGLTTKAEIDFSLSAFQVSAFENVCRPDPCLAMFSAVNYFRTMTEHQMTIQEIEDQFESEWVLVENPQTDEALEVTRGQVICHSKDRDEVYRRAVALRPKRSAILYTGRMPEDAAIVL